MILDTLDYADDYGALHPLLVRGLHFLRTANLGGLASGRHAIDGERLFAIVDEYTTRPRDRCKLEAHRRYHDIQYLARGSECIGYAPLSHLVETEPYDAQRDIAFFHGGWSPLILNAGMFAVFAPHDAHAPQLAAAAPAEVRKIVIKVEVAPVSGLPRR